VNIFFIENLNVPGCVVVPNHMDDAPGINGTAGLMELPDVQVILWFDAQVPPSVLLL
jgi:hypothetical protein